MTRLLSIILPHYQKQEPLKQIWRELLLQIEDGDQIIVVDDHSPDGVPVLDCDCTEVIQPPKHTPHTYRLCTLRNYGIEHARHDACIILDPDCLPNPYFLDYARQIYDPSILVGGKIEKIQADGSIKKDSREGDDGSKWIDYRDKGGAGIWGGVMLFSKNRVSLVGYFDEDFNGGWGAEEHEFASRCYHSGMRLRYSTELSVRHLYHPKDTSGSDQNRIIWKNKIYTHQKDLNVFTPYKPAVGVMVITMMRSELINQCLRSIYRNNIPLKTRLIVNGGNGETRKIANQWGRRWTVDLVIQERKWPAQVRNDSMRWAKGKGYKFLIFLDDDMVPFNNALVNLVKVIEQNPDVYALSGFIRDLKKQDYMLGGPRVKGEFFKLPRVKGLTYTDWVGGGLTIHRLDPTVYYDEDYQTGYNDYDWSMRVQEKGLRMAVTNLAGGYHGVKLTSKGVKRHRNSDEYNRVRYDKERHERMRGLFKEKWGVELHGGRIWPVRK